MATTTVDSISNSFSTRYNWSDLLGVRLPVALLLCVPLFAPQFLSGTRLLSLACTCAIYVIVANGLHVIFSMNGQLSLAHTSLWGVGAYAAGLMITHFGPPSVVLLPIAGFAGAAAAIAIGVPAFRTGGFSFAIITFAFAEILRVIANNWIDLTKGSLGITVFDSPDNFLGISFDTFDHLDHFYYLVLVFAYLSVGAVWLIRNSRFGKTFIAIRENEALARSLGVNTYLYKLGAFALSGAFAGVAGVFFVYHQKHIEPGQLSPFSALFTIQFLLMILIGGRHSVLGPAIGAIVVVFGPELTGTLFEKAGLDVITTGRAQIFFGTMLALSVLSAPAGIVGQTQRGYHVFFTSMRNDRERGHGWPRSILMAFGRSVIPIGSNE